MNSETRITRPVNFIRFHDLMLLVVEHEGVEYIEAKPLCDFAGVQWKGAKRTLQEGDNAVLYGATRLNPPQIASVGTLKYPEEGVLYLRLDRSRMYLARISTDRMRANGNETGAEQVLALQIEWAEVLHKYETHGLVVKPGRTNALRELHQLVRMRSLLTDVRERQAVTGIVHEELRALGMPLDSFEDPQGSLELN